MIAHRILDNDMGAVEKRPLTGIGTIHGLTIEIDFVTGKKENVSTKKMEDVIQRVILPEFPMGIVEMLSKDMGVTKVTAHCKEYLQDDRLITAFVDHYMKWVLPINASGKTGY